jgi:uncharacterized protein DUF1524
MIGECSSLRHDPEKLRPACAAGRAVDINLEHVLPKKPDGNWPLFTDEAVGVWVNRLGNQVLMRASDNADLKSTTFEAKKKTYASSPYVLTSQIADLEKWDAETVAVRQRALAHLAVGAWPT